MSTHHPLVELARKAIEAHVCQGETIDPPESLTPEMKGQSGTFVSLHDSYGQLRGCIGTFVPTRANVALEVIHNAIAAATRDPRFPPVMRDEVEGLSIKVDVLSAPEPVAGPEDLDPQRYGVIVQATEGWHRRGLLLPDLEGVDSVAEQIRICRLKAGIGPREPIELLRFEVHRYT
jgi:AmmeMemoRadiSam system protein A